MMAAVGFFNAGLVHAVNEEELEKFGDVMQFALPAIGLGATAYYKDKEGAKQWAYSGLTAVGTTTVMKGIYQKIRPESDSPTSFPSGHTTGAFFGAAFLDQRYGKWWGIPAYTAAGITGYSRVISDTQHVDDTVVGARTDIITNRYLVTLVEVPGRLIPFTLKHHFEFAFFSKI